MLEIRLMRFSNLSGQLQALLVCQWFLLHLEQTCQCLWIVSQVNLEHTKQQPSIANKIQAEQNLLEIQSSYKSLYTVNVL